MWIYGLGGFVFILGKGSMCVYIYVCILGVVRVVNALDGNRMWLFLLFWFSGFVPLLPFWTWSLQICWRLNLSQQAVKQLYFSKTWCHAWMALSRSYAPHHRNSMAENSILNHAKVWINEVISKVTLWVGETMQNGSSRALLKSRL